MKICDGCGAPLEADEVEYYETRCEKCERVWLDRIEAWRLGGPDLEFDATYNIPFG